MRRPPRWWRARRRRRVGVRRWAACAGGAKAAQVVAWAAVGSMGPVGGGVVGGPPAARPRRRAVQRRPKWWPAWGAASKRLWGVGPRGGQGWPAEVGLVGSVGGCRGRDKNPASTQAGVCRWWSSPREVAQEGVRRRTLWVFGLRSRREVFGGGPCGACGEAAQGHGARRTRRCARSTTPSGPPSPQVTPGLFPLRRGRRGPGQGASRAQARAFDGWGLGAHVQARQPAQSHVQAFHDARGARRDGMGGAGGQERLEGRRRWVAGWSRAARGRPIHHARLSERTPRLAEAYPPGGGVRPLGRGAPA
ncbi:hypothetical protein HNP84_003164 [Thermocatellispora tengchongensis]|uniref:Uncharacterized protein n=1 Tax=Thermocatellispora tengchongensis TaxID=1073253 RepID=A0A840P168_9ACTN|nr:hypothetical protein [Thermocatellispora tengchongensis]